jgi:hypothetical protein
MAGMRLRGGARGIIRADFRRRAEWNRARFANLED